MTLFPTTFRLAVDKTEALCVAYMDGRFDMEPEVIKAAATCFAALHAAGGKNPNHPTERITPAEQWRSNVQEVIKSMHRCLNELLITVDEGIFSFIFVTFGSLCRRAHRLLKCATNLFGADSRMSRQGGSD